MAIVKLPPSIPIKKAIDRARKLIHSRRDGTSHPFTLPLPKIDKVFGKIEPNTIMTLGGQSGVGKSTIGMFLMEEIQRLNTQYEYEFVVFNFEMLSETVILRELTKVTGLTTRQLKSTYETISDDQLELVDKALDEMENDPTTFISRSVTGRIIANSLYNIWLTKCKEEGKVLLYLIDHALLVASDKNTSQEKDKLFNLMESLNQVKLKIANEGGTTFGIVLSQLNRSMQSETERKDNPNHHYPTTATLFGSSSMEQFSDYIIIPHVPAKMHIDNYGPLNLPTTYQEKGELKNFIFFHLLKNRHDSLEESVVMCWNDYARASVTEVENPEQLIEDFNDGKTIIREDYEI